jgi:hypothetical protein
MGKRYLAPTSYRDKKCPHCGLYFSPRGLNGHIRFKHSKSNYIHNLYREVLENKKVQILGRLDTDEGLKDAVRLFLSEYLTK